MPSHSDLAALTIIAERIMAAQDQGSQITPITTEMPDFDIDAAYQVADLIHQARLAQGAVIAGRKIGFTNPAMWDRYGVQEPVWGYIYQHNLVSLADGPGTCSLRRFAEPKIEPEIAFHFHRTPPADADAATLAECIDWAAHSFEIVQSHYPGWQFKAADTIADAGLHAMLCVGERKPLAELTTDYMRDLATFSVALSCNGTLRENGNGSNALGHPLASLAHLVAVLAKQPLQRPIQAGELITTGTLTAAFPVVSGEVWKTELYGLELAGMTLAFTL